MLAMALTQNAFSCWRLCQVIGEDTAIGFVDYPHLVAARARPDEGRACLLEFFDAAKGRGAKKAVNYVSFKGAAGSGETAQKVYRAGVPCGKKHDPGTGKLSGTVPGVGEQKVYREKVSCFFRRPKGHDPGLRQALQHLMHAARERRKNCGRNPGYDSQTGFGGAEQVYDGSETQSNACGQEYLVVEQAHEEWQQKGDGQQHWQSHWQHGQPWWHAQPAHPPQSIC